MLFGKMGQGQVEKDVLDKVKHLVESLQVSVVNLVFLYENRTELNAVTSGHHEGSMSEKLGSFDLICPFNSDLT